MDKLTLTQIINTLNLVEVKGQENLSYLLGVINLLQQELNKPKEEGGKNGSTKQ